MSLFTEIILFLSAGGLALFIGALLAEAMLLVPLWRKLPAQEFFKLYAAQAGLLYAFFTPLTVVATLLALVAAIASVATNHPLSVAAVLAGVLALVILATYRLYFHAANTSFMQASIAPEATTRRISALGSVALVPYRHWACCPRFGAAGIARRLGCSRVSRVF